MPSAAASRPPISRETRRPSCQNRSKLAKIHRGAASAVGERTTEEVLAHSLGVLAATRPDGKARELLGVKPEVRELFSPRRHAVTRKTAELVRAFETKFGRAPNALQLDRLSRRATFATRKAKSHTGEGTEQRLERWDRELRAEVDGGLAQVAQDVLALAGQCPTPESWSPAAVIATALADVQDRKAGWTARISRGRSAMRCPITWGSPTARRSPTWWTGSPPKHCSWW